MPGASDIYRSNRNVTYIQHDDKSKLTALYYQGSQVSCSPTQDVLTIALMWYLSLPSSVAAVSGRSF